MTIAVKNITLYNFIRRLPSGVSSSHTQSTFESNSLSHGFARSRGDMVEESGLFRSTVAHVLWLLFGLRIRLFRHLERRQGQSNTKGATSRRKEDGDNAEQRTLTVI